MPKEHIAQLYDLLSSPEALRTMRDTDLAALGNSMVNEVATEQDARFLFDLTERNRKEYLLPPDLVVSLFERILNLGFRTADALRSFSDCLDMYYHPG